MAHRVYAAKRLGAFPELDEHIIHDPKSNNPLFRYLAGGVHFCTNLVEARESVAAMLNIQHANPATEVEYQPATGWTVKGRKATTNDEGSNMSATVIPAATEKTKPVRMVRTLRTVPRGKYKVALAAVEAKLQVINALPADTPPEQLAQHKKELESLRSAQSYQKGMQIKEDDARAQSKTSAPAKQKATVIAPTPAPAEMPMATRAQPRFSVSFGSTATIGVNEISDLEAVVRMVKENNF